MKKLFILLILLLLVFLFFFSDSAALACRAGIQLFVLRVLPSLLPFLIAGGTLSRLGAAQILAKPFEKSFPRLFSLPGESAFVFATGILCGNPMGAQLSADLHAQGVLHAKQAARTAALASFVSPAFLFGAVASGMLNEPKRALPIAMGHYLGAILTGLLFAVFQRKTEHAAKTCSPASSHFSPAKALVDSVSAAANVLPRICVFIAFFSVLLAALEEFGFFHLFPSPLAKALVTGIFEMTAGCQRLSALTLSPALQNACISLLLSFGGLCVLCQNIAFLMEHNVKATFYFLFRMVHGAFTFCIAFLFS